MSSIVEKHHMVINYKHGTVTGESGDLADQKNGGVLVRVEKLMKQIPALSKLLFRKRSDR
jgi:hypothetical protein